MSLRHNSNFTISTLSDAYKKKELSPVDVIEYLFEKIETGDKVLNSYITVCYEEARVVAKLAEEDIVNGSIKSPLHGIPISVKDLIYTKNIRTTMGSGVYQNFTPEYDATVITKLRHAGGIMIGKTNMHELAYGPTGDYSFFGPTRNPHNLKKMAGGSSSGSAVGVAASLSVGALGTDTGGSVRIPSSFCGVVGMKPTFGSVSNFGVRPLSFTMDHVGPITKDIKGNALLLNYLIGKDRNDPNSRNRKKEDFTAKIGMGVKDMVVAIPFSFFKDDADEEILACMEELIKALEFVGIRVKMIEIPTIDEILKASGITAHSEVYANNENIAYKENNMLGKQTRERILQGAHFTAHDYVNAQQDRHRFMKEFELLFHDIDFLITPTSPILPQDIGKRNINMNGNEKQIMSVVTKYTIPFNFLGLPSLALPWTMSQSGLPIGIQIVGNKHDEANLYRLGHILES